MHKKWWLGVWGALLFWIGAENSLADNQEAPQLIRDTEIENILREFTEPLFKAAGLPPKRLRLFLVGSSDVNAAASFDHSIFVHTGLITKADSPEELIGVLAHETGHIAGGHISQRFAKFQKHSLLAMGAMALGLATVLLGGGGDLSAAGAGLALGTQISLMGSVMHYTRGQEASADQKALALMDKLGWNAKGLLVFMKKLAKQELLSADRQDGFFRTHPFSSERVDLMQGHVTSAKAPDQSLPADFYPKFTRLRTKIVAFMEKPMVVLMKHAASDTSFNARYARCIAFYRMKNFNQATQLLEALIAETPNDPYLYDLKGQILFESGQPKESLKAYLHALRLCKHPAPLIQMAIAQCYLEMQAESEGQWQEAITILRQVSRVEAENPMVWKLMAVAYGRMKKFGQASLALAEEAMCLEDYDRAVGLGKKALGQLPNGPEKLQAVELVEKALKYKEERDRNSRF